MIFSRAVVRFVALVAAGLVGSAAAAGPCPTPRDMNGVWQSNDGGVYYVRQVGQDVWWLGVGATFTNVFHGVRRGNLVTGAWADVPKGAARGHGVWKLVIEGAPLVSGWNTLDGAGGITGRSWWSPCGNAHSPPY